MSRHWIFCGRVAALLLCCMLVLGGAPARAQLAQALTGEPPRSATAVRFRFMADGPVRGGFALAGERLLFGTEAGSIYAIGAADGRLLWTCSVGSPVLSTPAVDGARAYFASFDNVLHAVDASTGRELWRRDLGRTLGTTDYWEYYVSSPVLADGRLYVGSASGRLFAIEPENGAVGWWTDLGARIRSTPTIAGNAVLVGTNAGRVVAVDRASGRVKWSFATEGAAHDFAFKQNDTRSVVTAPIVVGDTVIAGGRDGNIYGIDLASGRGRWRETHDGGSWILGLAGAGKTFYSGSGSAFIVQAADVATGKEIWRTPTANAMFGGLAEAGGVLVSNGSNGSLLGIDAASGAQLWRLRLPDMAFSSPLVAAGAIYTGADDGSVTAFATSDARPPALDRYVYTYTDQPQARFLWFKPDVVADLKGQFGAAGYANLGTADLARGLGAPTGERGRKVVAIADARLPDGVGAAALRKFVDGGGILVLLGPNPAAFRFDPSGAPVAQDEEAAAAAFGMAAADLEQDNGYNVSAYMAAARPLGLEGRFVASRWARPADVSLVLGQDRSGNATAWTKAFGDGGQLVMLPVSRTRPGDLSRIIDAVELIAARSPAAAR